MKEQFIETIFQLATIKNPEQSEETTATKGAMLEAEQQPKQIVAHHLTKLNIFELLHTNEGFLALQAWFVKSLIICENNIETFS